MWPKEKNQWYFNERYGRTMYYLASFFKFSLVNSTESAFPYQAFFSKVPGRGCQFTEGESFHRDVTVTILFSAIGTSLWWFGCCGLWLRNILCREKERSYIKNYVWLASLCMNYLFVECDITRGTLLGKKSFSCSIITRLSLFGGTILPLSCLFFWGSKTWKTTHFSLDSESLLCLNLFFFFFLNVHKAIESQTWWGNLMEVLLFNHKNASKTTWINVITSYLMITPNK